MEEGIGKIEVYTNMFMDWAVVFVPKLILAILILFVGFWIVRKLDRWVEKAMKKAGLSLEITSFLSSIVEIVLKFVVVLVAAGILGFEVSSLVAVLAAAGFAVGLALQGFLGNFASGITIVFFKPYKVGDWVEISEKFGQVESIKIFNTTIITPGNKTLIIPNGQVTDGIITNFSTKGHIRIEKTVTMPYAESFPRVKAIIIDALKNVDGVMAEPEPMVGIESFDSHSVIIAIRPFIVPDHYWEVTFRVHDAVKKAFSDNGVQVSYSEGVELGSIGG
ncbi:MAG: mechanosensitive ion channel family protein [Saprospiraceae bacterium]